MTYATRTDMERAFGALELAQVTDRVNGTTVDETVLGEALARADAEINVYLASQYTLPLAASSPLLVALACDITRYALHAARASEEIEKRYKNAIAILRDIARGIGSLGLDDSGTAPVPVSGGVQVIAPARDFSDDVLAGF